MKKLLLVLLFTTFLFGNLKAQLDSITFINLPCYGAIGLSGIASTALDTGALYYEWSIGNGNINSIWFNGSPGPVQTTSPNVNLSFQTAQQIYIVCVTSYSACCSSNTFCDTVSGLAQIPVLSVFNSNTGIPGDSGIYSVDTINCPVSFMWTLTGDATFNNGNQLTGTINTSTNVNFGPGFTSATLCVKTITSVGLASDTVCMIINAPLGINGNDNFVNSIFFQPETSHIKISFKDNFTENASIKFYDLTGRQITFTQTQYGNNEILIVPAASLITGIYFIDLLAKGIHKTLKFIKTD